MVCFTAVRLLQIKSYDNYCCVLGGFQGQGVVVLFCFVLAGKKSVLPNVDQDTVINCPCISTYQTCMGVLWESRNIMSKHGTLSTCAVAIIDRCSMDCSCQGAVCIAVVQITSAW